jgi:hypothetical protein
MFLYRYIITVQKEVKIMLPYGIPRVLGIEFPDLGDIKEFAMKSNVGRLKVENNEYPSHFRHSVDKRRVRRHFKKIIRQKVKDFIMKEVSEFYNYQH